MEKRGNAENRVQMNKYLSKRKIKFYCGWKTVPVRLKFMVNLGKYIFLDRKISFAMIKSSKGAAAKIQRKLKLGKIIKFNNWYYTSLTVPHWPSKPFDLMVANGGFNFTSDGKRYSRQIDTAILAITRKCYYDCKHCYEHYNLGDKDIVPIERWKDVIKTIQKIGVSIITFSGGEPMLRLKGLLELLESSDKNLSDFHVHTSGYGVTPEKALALKNAGLHAAAIGLDDVNPERHDKLRGNKGSYKVALQAIECFQDAGIFTYINMCLTKDLIRSGNLMKYLELMKNINVGAVRFLEPKPCGGYFSKNTGDLFSEEDRKIVTEFFIEANTGKKYRDYPLISYEAYFEDPSRLGCTMGGHSHFHIDSLGNVEPCVFLPVSFGNIMEESFFNIYKRMRKAIPRPLHKPCPAVYLSEKIKTRINQGMALPVPYASIEQVWEDMFERI